MNKEKINFLEPYDPFMSIRKLIKNITEEEVDTTFFSTLELTYTEQLKRLNNLNNIQILK